MTDFSPFNVKDNLKHLQLDQIKSWQKEVSIPYSVAMYNAVKDFNLASVIRNACAFGFERIYIIGHRSWDRRGAVGAHNYVEIVKIPTFDEFIEHIGIEHVIALELPEHYPTVAHSFQPVHEFEWSPGDCLLLGEEGAGIPVDDLERVHHRVFINQPGAMRSLNAATAAGIAMHCVSCYAPHFI
jgi:tRNA G18 (ribose-2'-O)-methylase SpoU